MIVCPNCRFRVMSDVEMCPRCGCRLLGAIRLDATVRARPTLRDLAWRAFAPWGTAGFRFADWWHDEPDLLLPERSAYRALALSLVPGLGQWYNGQWKTGVRHFAAAAAAFGLGIAYVTAWWSDIAIALGLATVLWSMNHAMLGAQEINYRQRKVGLQRWVGFFLLMGNGAALLWVTQFFAVVWVLVAAGFFFAAVTGTWLAWAPGGRRATGRGVASGVLFFALGVGVFWGPTWLWHSALRLHRHNQDDFAPLILRGDRILFETPSVGWRPRRVGDIVLYDPPRYRVEVGSDLYLVNSPMAMERIVGLPGDVVERRDGVFYRNGAPAGPLERPLVVKNLPRDYRFEVPRGHFALMLSYGGSEIVVPGVGFTAPLPGPSVQIKLSVIPEEDVSARALLVYYPRENRRWVTDLPSPEE